MKVIRFRGYKVKGITRDSLYSSLRKKVEAQGIECIEAVLKVVQKDLEDKVDIEWIER